MKQIETVEPRRGVNGGGGDEWVSLPKAGVDAAAPKVGVDAAELAMSPPNRRFGEAGHQLRKTFLS